MSCSKPCSPTESERPCKRQRISFSDIRVQTPTNDDLVIITDKKGKVLFLGFFKKHNEFSNHYKTENTIKLVIEVNGEELKLEGEHSEKLFMLLKAHYFGASKELIQQINDCSDPREMRKLGRSIPNFIQEKWDKVSRKFMKACILAKFKCNPELLEKLLKTGDAYLAEASPDDSFYGIGHSAKEIAEIIQAAIEKGVEFDGTIEDYLKTMFGKFGRNVLGDCLMGVRAEFAPAA